MNPTAQMPRSSLALTIIGLVFLGAGVFYVFGSHAVHIQVPFLETLPHDAHAYIGGGSSVLGLACILSGEAVRRRHVARAANAKVA